MHRAKFEYWQSAEEDPSGSWRWHLKGGNGEIMAQGEGYASKANVMRAMRQFKQAVSTALLAKREVADG